MVKRILSKTWVQTILLVLAALVMLLLYTSCGTQAYAEAPVEDSEISTEATVDVEAPESAPVEEPAPAAVTAPLPNIDINSWEFTLANSFNSITEFRPEHGSILGFTVDFGESDARMVDDAIAFQNAAINAGYNVHYDEIYVCYEWAELRYINKVGELGSATEAAKVVAGPGVGDHQTALGADFVELYGNGYDVVSTEAFNWLVSNCADYGFILLSPEGKEMYYGNACPNHAHFRYVGREAARYIMDSDLCLEEFIRLYDVSKAYVPSLD